VDPDAQHVPAQQIVPDAQVRSQLPQWLVSLRGSTHWPRQLIRPTGHAWHGPLETVHPWFWNCTHAVQSLWDSDGPDMSRHW
jgi:hypothetical protein